MTQPTSPPADSWPTHNLPLNPWASTDDTEPLEHGGGHLLDLVAAVDHLARGLRPHFTVWDALEEALRSWLNEHPTHTTGAPTSAPAPDESDPLRNRLAQLHTHLDTDPTATAAAALQEAIRRWANTMSNRYNAGYHWPHPLPRRGFPPPLTSP